MICTTLNKIRENNPCTDGWKKLLTGLGKTAADDEPLPMVTILGLNGLDDALWALRTTDCARELRLLTVAYARQVQHLMTDARSVAALDVAERFANGKATREELIEARVAAEAAWNDAVLAAVNVANAAARAAEWAAEWAAANAANAANAAVNDANDAVLAAVNVANAAARAAEWAAARAAARAAAAWAAMREKQVELFKEILG